MERNDLIVQEILPIFQGNRKYLENLTFTLAKFLKCSIAGISLIDSKTIHLIASLGIENKSFPNNSLHELITLTSHQKDEVLILSNISESGKKEKSFASQSSSIFTHPPWNLQFYAAVSLYTSDEMKIGTLFLMDHEAHAEDFLNEEKKVIFKAFASALTEAISSPSRIKPQLTHQLAQSIFLSILKEAKGLYQLLVTNQEEFSSTMKLLQQKTHSKTRSEEVKQSLLHSIEALQTLIPSITDQLSTLLKNSMLVMNSLKPLLKAAAADDQMKEAEYHSPQIWAKSLKKSIPLSRAYENQVKWQLFPSTTRKTTTAEKEWEISTANQEIIQEILSLYLLLQLPKWNEITIHTQMIPEQQQQSHGQKNYHASSATTNSSSSVVLPAPQKRRGQLIIEMTCTHRPTSKNDPLQYHSENKEMIFFFFDEFLLSFFSLQEADHEADDHANEKKKTTDPKRKNSYEKQITTTSETCIFTFDCSILPKATTATTASSTLSSASKFLLKEDSRLRSFFTFGGRSTSSPSSSSLQQLPPRPQNQPTYGKILEKEGKENQPQITEDREDTTILSKGAGSMEHSLDLARRNLSSSGSKDSNELQQQAGIEDEAVHTSRTEGYQTVKSKPLHSSFIISSNSQQRPPPPQRRRSSIRNANKIKANIFSSLLDTLITVTTAPVSPKKNVIVPINSD